MKMAIQRRRQEALASKSIEDPVITFFNVPPHIIERFCSNSCGTRIKLFDKANKLVVVKMPLRPHEVTTEIGRYMVEQALKRSGMLRAASAIGTANALDVAWPTTNEGKQPDASWKLRTRYTGTVEWDEWPQIVIEVGTSETRRQVQADIRHWFEHAHPALRLAITINLTNDEFRMTAWIPGDCKEHVSRSGDIVARRKDGEYRLCSGSAREIRIPFAVIFAKEPLGTQQDFTLSARDFMMKKFALERIVAQNETEAARKMKASEVSELRSSQVPSGFVQQRVDSLPRRKTRKGRRR
ncbi:hypothetical protein KEM56_005599 [Ascosphaera pollenicola]|nr:hypothetical protein KEM56_005599 [Ascosphaera pollenicola]